MSLGQTPWLGSLMWGLEPSEQCENSGGGVNSRVSSKIQQLLNTLKRPKRPPLKEFFVDDFEELLEGERPMPVLQFV